VLVRWAIRYVSRMDFLESRASDLSSPHPACMADPLLANPCTGIASAHARSYRFFHRGLLVIIIVKLIDNSLQVSLKTCACVGVFDESDLETAKVYREPPADQPTSTYTHKSDTDSRFGCM
jgi:hypothetical protein